MTTHSAHSLLVVDDEPDLRTLYELTLLREGYDVETAGSVEDAWERLQVRSYSAVITDMRLPDGTGLELMGRMERTQRRERVIMITAYGSPENAVEALKAGAFDYLTKPVDLRQFRGVVASALGLNTQAGGTVAQAYRVSQDQASRSEARAEARADARAEQRTQPQPQAPLLSVKGPAVVAWPPADDGTDPLERLAGQSASMRDVRALVRKVSRSMAPVLIQGESGTGKELVARGVHDASQRRVGAFLAVNCGAIPEHLLEAEFFGYRKGAFTGAQDDREGFFQAARGGTLFLDEIGDLPLGMQSKLLRAIQERAVRPVGAVAEVPVDVRIVSATHKDLGDLASRGLFRQDLYYRLNVIQIRVPPLRERLEDLPAICDTLLARIAHETGQLPASRLTRSALDALARHPFPGNVRELENLLHRATALSGGLTIDAEDLGLAPAASLTHPAPDEAQIHERVVAPQASDGSQLSGRSSWHLPEPLPTDLQRFLDDVERAILLKTLEAHHFNRTAAGASLGLTLRQMRYRIARLGIQTGGESGGETQTGDLDDTM